MWFKRRKNTDQDHALSESLRSLQSLLSETGRREPSLDTGDMPSETDVGASTRPGRAAGETLATDSGNGARPEKEHRDAPSGEPQAPGESGNRWRDLNLSFDAEPVLPRARRKGNADADGGADGATHHAAPEGPDQPEPDVVTYGLRTAPAPGPRHGGDTLEDPGATDAPHRHGTPAVADRNDAPDHGFPSRSDDEVLVLDLEAPQSPPPGAEAGEPSTSERADLEGAGAEGAAEARIPEPGNDGGADNTVPAADSLESPGEEQDEDQLHLELETSEAFEADIPVLTNAVYVPETPPEAPASPGPAESPQEERIARYIDNVRDRLQLAGLDTLSGEQEKELHDALVDFLDELEHD